MRYRLVREDVSMLLPHEFQEPTKIPSHGMEEVFETYELTREFSQEVRYRDGFDRYCQWYYAVARRHRKELQQIRTEPNFLRWLRS